MFNKILIANRGEIACRIMRTAQSMGIKCVAVYSDADHNARHVKMADEAWRLGPAPVAESYLLAARIIDVAKASGSQAIHPGYGFLAENPDFVEACDAADIVFIGPSAAAIQAMGLKDAAKQLMTEAGVAVVPGYHGINQSPDFLAEEATKIGYPVLIKARAGGGGKGMRRVDHGDDFLAGLDAARRESEASFGDGHVLIEKYITSPRHIEVQVFGDQHGNTIHLFERDCSLQRRHQKVIEEAPAPGMTDEMREAMGAAAVRAAQAVNYAGAGTVEFIVDASEGLRADRFYFMEMNTRLQVEHPVTEAITGLDLVAWQLLVAAGEVLPMVQDKLSMSGHAFEARVYAEDVPKGFIPAIGTLTHLHLPEEQARIDSGVVSGDEITPFYDPMIAKVTVHAATRDAALNKLVMALQQSRVAGCVTNIDFLARLASHAGFARAEIDTGLIDRELDGLINERELGQEVFVLAGLAGAGLLGTGLSGVADEFVDPWDQLVGWSHWGDRQQFVELVCQEQDYVLTVTRPNSGAAALVAWGEQSVAVTGIECVAQGDGVVGVRLNVDSRMLQAHLLDDGQAITVFYAGQTLTFQRVDYLHRATEGEQAVNQLIAPMPGQVKIISAAVGDTVQAGDALMVMEAMKMELTLTAPRGGVVAEITVIPGDQVADGTVLLRLEDTV